MRRPPPSRPDVGHALALLRASVEGRLDLLQSPHFLAEVAAVLARQLDHRLFDTLYHALALDTPGDAVLVTADRRYFAKARHLGRIAWLADFQLG